MRGIRWEQERIEWEKVRGELKKGVKTESSTIISIMILNVKKMVSS
jgi:hypothetical protein